MGVLDFVKGGSGGVNTIKKEAVFGLTPLGKDRLKKMAGTDEEFKLLGTVSQHSPCTLEEITDQSGITWNKAKHLIQQGVANGYIQVLGARGE